MGEREQASNQQENDQGQDDPIGAPLPHVVPQLEEQVRRALFGLLAAHGIDTTVLKPIVLSAPEASRFGM